MLSTPRCKCAIVQSPVVITVVHVKHYNCNLNPKISLATVEADCTLYSHLPASKIKKHIEFIGST